MPNGLSFSGYLQPPAVPPDPTGDDWRGLTGPPGPPGTLVAFELPTAPDGLEPGALWRNGDFVCVV